MSSIVIYGASDDLIEIDGDIREEFNPSMNDDESWLLAISDGTVLRITYGKMGIWRLAPVIYGTSSVDIQQAPEDDDENYSDRATLTTSYEDLVWVVLGTAIAKSNV